MEDRLINRYLSRILSGYLIFTFNDKQYKLKYPDISIKYEADILADQEFENIKFSGWPTKDSIVYDLINLGLWTFDGDTKLKSLEKLIEDTKVELYKSSFNPVKVKKIRKNLEGHQNSYNRLYSKRHCFDYITIEGYCDNVKNQYLLLHSIYNEDNNLIEDLYNNSILFNKLCEIINQQSIEISMFKKIARSDIWRNYWSANKENLFGKATIDWTDEQKTLVVLTKMYDNAYEHPECPSDNVIEDDDMFEGWMILQKRENEKNKNKNKIEKSLSGKLNNAGEVFIIAESKEEAQVIHDLNDAQGQGIINERKQALNRFGQVEEQQFPDSQRSILLQTQQNVKNTRK